METDTIECIPSCRGPSGTHSLSDTINNVWTNKYSKPGVFRLQISAVARALCSSVATLTREIGISASFNKEFSLYDCGILDQNVVCGIKKKKLWSLILRLKSIAEFYP